MEVKLKRILKLLLLLLYTTGCNKSKDIDIKLPVYDKKLVVECYLEPGKPYRLLLTESVSYFDVPSVPQVSDAKVSITHRGKTDSLRYVTLIPGTTDSSKFYNFASSTRVPPNYNDPFYLTITDKAGRYITAKTIIPPPVYFDTLRYEFEGRDSLGYVLGEIIKGGKENGFYRMMLLSEEKGTTRQKQDIYFDEKLSSTSPYLIGLEDRIILKTHNEVNRLANSSKQSILLYHLEESFYNFLKSVNDSQNANGNPFAQPGSVTSNINGGMGIFTGFSITRYILTPPPID